MRKREAAFIIAIILVMSGIPFLTQASETKEKQIFNQNQQIYLGIAHIIGDGSEANTTVDAVTENEMAIKISSETSLVDFFINYSMVCSGTTDSGLITLIIQINQENKGHVEVATVDLKEGQLFLENLEIKRGDALSFEVGAVYTNLIPSFVVPDVAIGGGVVSKQHLNSQKYINDRRECDVTYLFNSDEITRFEINEKAKDINGEEAEWSDPLPVSMPLKHQTLREVIIEWILQLVRDNHTLIFSPSSF